VKRKTQRRTLLLILFVLGMLTNSLLGTQAPAWMQLYPLAACLLLAVVWVKS
jgi:hypothetical protein